MRCLPLRTKEGIWGGGRGGGGGNANVFVFQESMYTGKAPVDTLNGSIEILAYVDAIFVVNVILACHFKLER